LLSSMKTYDNPFIIPTTIGYQDHWRNGISSESQIDQTKRWMETQAAPQTALWIEVGDS
jgi:hypothetical protein